MNCNINCACTGLLGAGVINSSGDFIPPELETLKRRLKNEYKANINVDAIISVFWERHQPDVFSLRVSFNGSGHQSHNVSSLSRGRRAGYNYFNDELGMGLDNNFYSVHPIKNIAMLNSSKSPDGIYNVYLGFSNHSAGDVPFDFSVLYRSENSEELAGGIWLKGIIPGNRSSYSSKYFRGVDPILNLRKKGRVFTLENIHPNLRVVFKH